MAVTERTELCVAKRPLANWITVSWSMIAGAFLALGLIELLIGLAQPPRVARLMFSLSAFHFTLPLAAEEASP